MSNKPKLQTVKMELEIPIPVKDEKGNVKEVTELVFHRLKVKHLKGLPSEAFEEDNINPEHAIPLIATAARMPKESVEEIDLVDLERVVKALSPFLPKSQKTGKK